MDECASVDTDSDGVPDSLVVGCMTSLMADTDDDNDNVPDTADSCPTGSLNVASGADATPTADIDDDGCKNSEDMDDNNNGLIEIATAAELNNMRHNLAGTTYDDEADDGAGNAGDITGAPTTVTTNCDTATSDSVYLCGYELTADIDFFGADGSMGGVGANADIDLNGGTAGNIDPIAGNFTAAFHGNDQEIANMTIIFSFGRAALFRSCVGSHIRDLTLANPSVTGANWIASLCATATNAMISNVSVTGGSIAGAAGLILNTAIGGLIAGLGGTSRVIGCSFSGSISNGGAGRDTMGGLVGNMGHNTQVISSHSSGTVSDGGDNIDAMGGLVGNMGNNTQVIGSSSDSAVSDGGDNIDIMGGLIGNAQGNARIISSHSSGAVSNGGAGGDAMGGLVGNISNNAQVIGSRASGAVSNGGLANDAMGGLAGNMINNAQVIGVAAAGTVSDGGASDDFMGGLLGVISGLAILRDSSSSGMVCAADTSGCDAGSNGADRVGGLIGLSVGTSDASNDPQIHNCLATGAVNVLATEDMAGGFIGVVLNGTVAKLNASMTNNRYDTDTTTLSTTMEVGQVPDFNSNRNRGDDLASLSGITGSATTALQIAAAYTSWLTARWLFAMSAYPQPLYFDYDPANPATHPPTAATTIDVCETITPTNNTAVDEGDADKPDCGDVLTAWPRP